MATNEEFHVMSLTPRQQAATRLLLFNLYCGFIKKTMEDIADRKGEKNLDAVLLAKSNMIMENFNKYDEFTNVLPGRVQAGKGEIKFITFTPLAMRNVLLSVQGFDQKNCFLSKSDVQFVLSELKKLGDIVQTSIMFTFTEEEIKKESGR